MSSVDLDALAHFYHNRTYAITGKNKWITGILFAVATAQLGLGVYMLVSNTMKPSEYFHPIRSSFGTKGTFPVTEISKIPLDSYHVCLALPEKTSMILQFSLSIFFGEQLVTFSDLLELNRLSVPLDALVFVCVIVQIRLIGPTRWGMTGSSILDTVARDTQIYFVLISTSHFLIVVIFVAARVGPFAQLLEFNTC